MTWNPESEDTQNSFDLTSTISSQVKSTATSRITKKFRTSNGNSYGDVDMIAEAAPLVFPELDELVAQTQQDAAKKKGKLSSTKKFVDDYGDRRARAKYVCSHIMKEVFTLKSHNRVANILIVPWLLDPKTNFIHALQIRVILRIAGRLLLYSQVGILIQRDGAGHHPVLRRRPAWIPGHLMIKTRITHLSRRTTIGETEQQMWAFMMHRVPGQARQI